MAKLPKLTIKQKRFLKYYLQDPSNAAEAARKAGYAPKYAKETAHHLLNRNTLLPYLEIAATKGELDTGMNEEDIYSLLHGMASTNIFDIMDVHQGRAIVVKDINDIPYEMGQYIQALKETAHGIEVKFYDKSKALDMLAKMKNMYSQHQKSGVQEIPLAYNLNGSTESK
jgi:phage terminase small subunit